MTKKRTYRINGAATVDKYLESRGELGVGMWTLKQWRPILSCYLSRVADIRDVLSSDVKSQISGKA